MTLVANLFLGCFLFGFVLTIASLLFGMGVDHSGGDGTGAHHTGHTGSSDGGDTAAGAHHHSMSLLNFNSIVMFLTWFGAAGYILMASGKASLVTIFSGAITAGFIGAIAVFLFMNKLLLKGEHVMRTADYYLPGTLARVTSPVRQGGTGEIVYTQGGTRKTAGARSDEGASYRQGEEVVIVRYEKGIAYVRSMEADLTSPV